MAPPSLVPLEDRVFTQRNNAVGTGSKITPPIGERRPRAPSSSPTAGFHPENPVPVACPQPGKAQQQSQGRRCHRASLHCGHLASSCCLHIAACTHVDRPPPAQGSPVRARPRRSASEPAYTQLHTAPPRPRPAAAPHPHPPRRGRADDSHGKRPRRRHPRGRADFRRASPATARARE